ncbi:Uncharacterised protein [Klebsiella variicola]|nr:Uncharacterised protein [Klebsiella variicola]
MLAAERNIPGSTQRLSGQHPVKQFLFAGLGQDDAWLFMAQHRFIFIQGDITIRNQRNILTLNRKARISQQNIPTRRN